MATAAQSEAAQQAMEELTAQWYDAVVTGLELDPNTFQLAQGFPVLGSTTEELWEVFDALPPATLTHFWNPAQLSSFGQTYSGVVSALSPPGEAAFVQKMGDYYNEWNEYKKRAIREAQTTEGLIELFRAWSQANMPSGQGAQALKLLQGLMGSPVMIAMNMLLQAGALSGSAAWSYDTTNEKLQTALGAAAGPKSVQMDSSTATREVDHTWARGEMGGLYDFFWGGASGEYDKLTTQVAEAGVDVEATFRHVLTFTAGPLDQPHPNDARLARFRPWYDSAALAYALQNPEDEFWASQPPTWQATFGPRGTLQRKLTSLVLVSGVETTVTSAATFSDEEQETIKASASFGFFPFFEAEASGGWEHQFRFSEDGAMTVTSTIPGDRTVVLGAIVTPIASSLEGGA